MKEVELKDIARLRTTKIECSSVSNDSYIGTDNMRQDKAGITPSIYAPKTGTTPAYHVNDILISNIRPYLKKIWLADRSGGCSTDITVIQVNNELANPVFVYYCLIQNSFFDYLMLGAKGTKMPRLDKAHLMRYRIPLFDKKTQDAIADLLSVLDSRRHTNDRINENLEKLMREIYDYWFVQFDFPDANGRPYKSSGGEMVYDEKLKREIPKGWKACNILDVADWVGGAQPPKSTFVYEPRNGYIRFIQNRDYADDSYKTWIPKSKSNKICDRLDIMMDKYGDAGRIRFGLAGAYNVALAKIAIEKENLREYIRGFLSSEAIYQYLYNACMASTRASLNEEILGNLNLAMPSEEILSQYQTIAEQNIQLILTLSDENKQLASLRDWLLPMLMNGQVRIAE